MPIKRGAAQYRLWHRRGDDKWVLTLEDGDAAIRASRTKSSVEPEARRIARNNQPSILTIKTRDGSIQDRVMYGDPAGLPTRAGRTVMPNGGDVFTVRYKSTRSGNWLTREARFDKMEWAPAGILVYWFDDLDKGTRLRYDGSGGRDYLISAKHGDGHSSESVLASGRDAVEFIRE